MKRATLVSALFAMLVVSLIGVIVGAFVPKTLGGEMQLRAQCRVEGTVVRLGDVADVFASSAGEAARLRAIEICPAPADGTTKTLSARAVQDLLALRQVALGEHRFSGAAEVKIQHGTADGDATRPSARMSLAVSRAANRRLQEAIAAYLTDNVADDREWIVDVHLNADQVRRIPAGLLAVDGGREPWVGTQKFSISSGSGPTAARVDVEARVSLPAMLVVATRPLAKGDSVRASDVALAPGKNGPRGQGTFATIEQVVGLEAVRPVAAGQVLDANYLRPPILVNRGDVVTVYAYSAGIRVKTTARARQPGSAGEVVEVESLADRKRYFGRVSDVQEVEVYAGATRAAAEEPSPPRTARR